MLLNCHRCKKEWEYNGEIKPEEYPQYTSCPRCKTSIKIQKDIKGEPSQLRNTGKASNSQKRGKE